MKISLILPYWDRQEAANKAFELLATHYKDLDLEVVVIDDGNAIPFVKPDVALDIKVITLPLKHIPMCPATAWNAGVAEASGDVVVLSCIEILHDVPVLQEMAERLQAIGKDGYVLASAWCPEEGAWHCHSSIKTPRNPWGTGIAFCGMMYKELYNKAGGFGEEYREGAGYEDNDFINRMLSVGAKFKICDDLVVTHPKSGASIQWPEGSFQRNEEIFYKKWPNTHGKSITFVCVNWGDYCGRGKDYVNKLFDGIYNNLPSGTSCRFVCFSDVLEPSQDGVRYSTELLPQGVNGWWNKLYLFKEGLFKEGERVIYFDLDTVITGTLEDIIKYDGDFATLRDFYHPERLGPGVMLWKGGFGKEIWNSYEAAGYPTDLPLGDLSWINKYFSETDRDGRSPTETADILQELYPDKFCSYKAHAQQGIPEKASVVCFHGFPRPHEAGGWVDAVWEKGLAKFESFVVPNTTIDVAAKNIRSACERDLPWLEIESENVYSKDAVIVGGAPSLKNKLEEIKIRKENGQFIIATNGTHDYLVENGITPDAHIIIDARPENAKFVASPREGVKYYIASQCVPEVFEALVGYNTKLLHINTAGIVDAIPPTDKPINLLSGGSTVGMIAISLAHVLGFRHFHIYGMDSSYTEGEHHAYTQEINNNENVLEVEAGGRKFLAAPWMIQQANEFQQLAALLVNEDCVITVAGDGLLPHIAKLL
jgi:hypothetical protein